MFTFILACIAIVLITVVGIGVLRFMERRMEKQQEEEIAKEEKALIGHAIPLLEEGIAERQKTRTSKAPDSKSRPSLN